MKKNPIVILFSFHGRIDAWTLWLYLIPILLIDSLLRSTPFTFDLSSNPAESWLSGAYTILFGWAILALHAKRWHDLDKSAWWILPHFASVLVLSFSMGNITLSEGIMVVFTFPLRLILFIISLSVVLYFLIQLGFRSGTPGANRFGISPSMS